MSGETARAKFSVRESPFLFRPVNHAMRAAFTVALLATSIDLAMGAETPLPVDVQAFLDRRAGCEHWRGEEPYDEERRIEIATNACELCRGTDAQLERLKKKYRTQAKVILALSQLEDKIELPSPEAMTSACSAEQKRSRAPSRP